METLFAAALLLSNPTTLSQSTPEQMPAPIEVPVENNAQPESENLETPLACGPNQFPSAFSDVYPTDWAYQAVNRLSSRPIECFDFPRDESAR